MIANSRPLTWIALSFAFVMLPTGLHLIGTLMPSQFSTSNETTIQRPLDAAPAGMTQGRG
ncbi:hypothetical protein [Kocuria rosea]|uniref:hypothetical protein n=1 Tax=Kocuria rosea TaxID=1275 RepID=UPI0011A4B931|nr:hypothetical protein [Kocuria rosea]